MQLPRKPPGANPTADITDAPVPSEKVVKKLFDIAIKEQQDTHTRLSAKKAHGEAIRAAFRAYGEANGYPSTNGSGGNFATAAYKKYLKKFGIPYNGSTI